MWYRPFSINLFYEREFIIDKLHYPEDWYRWKLWSFPPFTTHHQNLNYANDSTRTKKIERNIHSFDLLNSYRRSTQTPEELASTDVFHFYLEHEIIAQTYQSQQIPLSIQKGLQFPIFMILYHDIESVQDASDYIQRLSQFPLKVQTQMEDLIRYEESGNQIYTFMFETLQAQIKSLTDSTKPIEKHLFIKIF